MKATETFRRRRNAIPILVLVATVIGLTACATSTQPAMNQGHVAALTTGELRINVPPHDVFVAPPPEPLQNPGSSAVDAGATPMAGAATNLQSAQSNPELESYAEIISSAPLKQGFSDVGKEVAGAVIWLSSANPRITAEPGPLQSAWMQRQAQRSPFDAVAFAQPMVVFSQDMKRLTIRALISVYARGLQYSSLLDSGIVTATTPLGKAGDSAGNEDMGNLAKSDGNGSENISARTKLWFANHGARYKSAIKMNMSVLTQRLVNYFHGHG